MATLTLAAAVLAGCAVGQDSGTAYTKLRLTANCDSPDIALGQNVDDIAQVTNTGGHRWAATYASVDGGGMRVNAVAMDDRQGVDLGGTFNLGPLPAGGVGDIHVNLTGTKGQTAPRVTVQVFGASRSVGPDGTLDFPDSTWEIHCDHAIQ